ncbi:HAD family hydrolase [Ferrimonas marina]|uniref:Haloacid dehalogenase superfamily, subfamily IA, variant 3 with third motif having DD or ED n=1 Tax=Ferrimonas marina TaxID=299255 RepID=A0A1M5NZX5_9GAMM|nr:HAD family phosphatase [Ferrimonas marina]SHG95048.1 haloacid dehalogenase superfamily, subfamily IA, variant 3 with third motif having DD or ED [Ferrimonas marina]
MTEAPITAVLFDMDGLIFDTERSYRQAWHYAAKEQGFELDDALYLSMIGMPRTQSEPKLARALGPGLDLPRYRQQRDAHFRQLQRQGIPFQAGFEPLFQRLTACQIPTALVTSSRMVDVEENFAQRPYLSQFATTVTCEQVQRGKPDPEPYQLACQRLRLAPAQCLVVEDSNNGIRSGLAAGCRTAMVPDLQAPDSDVQAQVHHLLDSLEQLLPTLADQFEPGRLG